MWPTRIGWWTAAFLAAYIIFLHSFWWTERQTWRQDWMEGVTQAVDERLIEHERAGVYHHQHRILHWRWRK